MSMRMTVNYNTKLFTDVFDNATDFITEYKASGIPYMTSDNLTQLVSDANLQTLYYLLYARHGNDPITQLDENQWKYRLYSIIFQYGPTWQKRLKLQEDYRALTLDDLKAGSKAIYNRALNPSGAPSTDALTEIEYINEQNTTNYKRSVAEALTIQWDALRVDVSELFLKQFDKLFKTFVSHERPTLYIEEDDENE